MSDAKYNLNTKTESMLDDYIYTKAEIKSIILEIEELENNYDLCKSIDFSQCIDTNTLHGSSVESNILLKDHRLPKLKRLRRAKEIQIEKVDNAMTILCDKEKQIIENRYFKKLQWDTIAVLLDLTDVRCRQIRTVAINKLRSILFIEV